ncbi:dihydroneopterin aldolase [Limimaricola pyoseonensis]|uniref:dihydroneopterin aldolase n=1 Tax=Limimaricola pyoseonensis TaxID=521013 RepID=A0A1G7D4K3_9RHOB|nr:dihydroneopterin aldolase [Limimaricola pyoseonensis]SDE46431.1 dihydroneopterin aldolase [Limimaricola pyoseonensis]
MTDDTRQAFDLAARAQSGAETGAAGPRDRLLLRDYPVEVEIGAFQAERGKTQRLVVDIVTDLRPAAPAGDDVDRILSYDRLTEAVDSALAAERLDLLETLAERIAARLLAEPQVERVYLRIRKLDRGPGELGVEIMREDASDATEQAGQTPRPVVALIGAATAAAPERWRDMLLAEAGPLVICVAPAAPGLAVPDPVAQARIDLLAFDQAAWAMVPVLGLEVRDSRTELDWAMRRGAASLWAPSRMVAAAVEPPAGTGPGDLAAWLADRFDAREILLLGADAPGARCPARRLDPAP